MAWKPALAGPAADPIWKRLDASVRAAIEKGSLRPGDRLPSAADVATALRINKLTVVKAFRGLMDAGLVRAHVGRGTFVSDGRPAAKSKRPASGETAERGAAARAAGPSAASDASRALRRVREGYAKSLRDLTRLERKPGTIDLVGGVPSPESVDEALLEKLTREVLANDPRRLYAYGGESGLPELRKAIAAMLAASGIEVNAEQVLVTNGSQQAVSLVAAWARDEERAFVGETPTFIGVPQAFLLFGHAVSTVPWDDEGIDVAQLRAAAPTRPLLHTCPDFQNPTGRTMTLARRRDLVAWAEATDAVVLEDAIVRDLRFEGETLPSLFSLLPPGRRILVGSVSKSFMTGLRVGYLVADAPFIEALRPFKRAMDLGSPSLVQAIAAAFLEDGYAAHVAKMRATYRERRDALAEALAREMPEGTTFTRPSGGFQLWVTPPDGTSSVDLYLRGLAHGVAIGPGPVHDIDGRFADSFRCGYARATPDELREGVRRIARAHADLRARRPSSSPGVVV